MPNDYAERRRFERGQRPYLEASAARGRDLARQREHLADPTNPAAVVRALVMQQPVEQTPDGLRVVTDSNHAESRQRPHLTYLASPYSHSETGMMYSRAALACRVAATMLLRGDLVLSPIAHGHAIWEKAKVPGAWDFWSRLSLRLLDACDSLTVLCIPGWRESEGVRAEIAAACSRGMPIRFVDKDGNEIAEPVTVEART